MKERLVVRLVVSMVGSFSFCGEYSDIIAVQQTLISEPIQRAMWDQPAPSRKIESSVRRSTCFLEAVLDLGRLSDRMGTAGS